MNKTTYLITQRISDRLFDTITPVNLYLRLRDRFPQSLLLESNDFRGGENSFSYICCQPLATFRVFNAEIIENYPGHESRFPLADGINVLNRFQSFLGSFSVEDQGIAGSVLNGVFGYMAYDAISLFEDIELKQPHDPERHIPTLCYSLYQYVFSIDHHTNRISLLENRYADSGVNDNGFDPEQYLSASGSGAAYGFKTDAEERSNLTDHEYLEMVRKCQQHIKRGDVFQIVPSRRFIQSFTGDEFNVYRSLRSINPSPYLFYFDYGGFRLFGSSPETQLMVRDRKASIFPIAGTYRRSGDEMLDAARAETLKNDPKEGAEHVMLVDLARNDLSKHCKGVRLESFKEIQYYSHVIHLVSKVTGKLLDGKATLSVLGDTFPAGTLSGAPKYRAMELIDAYERGRRYFYGGAIGFIGFNGDCNHAIMIRSFLSKDGVLYYQAGGGVVADSVPESELQEVNNKLLALKNAIKMAEDL